MIIKICSSLLALGVHSLSLKIDPKRSYNLEIRNFKNFVQQGFSVFEIILCRSPTGNYLLRMYSSPY